MHSRVIYRKSKINYKSHHPLQLMDHLSMEQNNSDHPTIPLTLPPALMVPTLKRVCRIQSIASLSSHYLCNGLRASMQKILKPHFSPANMGACIILLPKYGVSHESVQDTMGTQDHPLWRENYCPHVREMCPSPGHGSFCPNPGHGSFWVFMSQSR